MRNNRSRHLDDLYFNNLNHYFMKNLILIGATIFTTSLQTVHGQWQIIEHISTTRLDHISGYGNHLLIAPNFSHSSFYAIRADELSPFEIKPFDDTLGTGIHEIQFLSNDIGYMAAGTSFGLWNVILKTTDGGASWHSIVVPASLSSHAISNISFINSVEGFMNDERGNIYHTMDGGITFMSHTIPLSPDSNEYYICDLKFYSSTEGIAVVRSDIQADSTVEFAILKTIDGATTWEHVHHQVYTGITHSWSYLPKNIQYITDDLLYVMGNNGLFFKSIDGGVTWTQPNPSFNEFVNSFHFINELKGFAAVDDKIILTNDGGVSWHTNYENDSLFLHTFSLHFPNNEVGYALANSSLIGDNTSYVLELDMSSIDSTLNNDETHPSLFNIYPNPTNEFIHINSTSVRLINNIELIDISGRIIKTFDKSANKLSISELPKGIYFLKIESENKLHLDKIIIN